jgi:hypothetical protein
MSASVFDDNSTAKRTGMIANLGLLDFMVTISRAPKLRLLDDM